MAAKALSTYARRARLNALYDGYELIHSRPLLSEVLAAAGLPPVPDVTTMLAPFFKGGWKGDACEPVLPSPPTLPQTGGAELDRPLIEAAIEILISKLDAIDGDANLEDGGDLEPSLSGHAYSAANGASYIAVPHDQDLELDTSDLEPSLSTPEGRQYYSNDDSDLEEEHDGREPDVDDEPSLSAPEALRGGTRSGLMDPLDQTRWLRGDSNELEEQCEDEGGACEDEGADNGDREPDDDHMCNWQDEGDQTVLRELPVYCKRVAVKSPHQNVGELQSVSVRGGVLVLEGV